jgi:hypothetical protein
MKKTFLKFAYVSAIALTGMMGFSACQSDSAEEVNPNYDPETNAVKTEFAFNISSNAKQKMTGANTQQKVEDDGTGFLGMNTMWLYCLAADPADDSGFLTNGQINLGSLGTLAASEISGSQSSKVYSMYLPVGTKNFLFYGSQAGKAHDGKHANGQLKVTFPDAKYDTKDYVGDITFALTPIIEKSESELNTAGNTLKGYLNTILAAKVSGGTYDAKTWKGTQYYLNAPQNNTEVGAQFKEIASLYYAFVQEFKKGRQLSAYDTKRSVEDLYNMIIKINTNSTNEHVKAVATAVKTAIEANFTPTEVEPVTTPKTYTLAYKSDDANVTNFPLEQGLPAGSVVITSNLTDVASINADTYSTFDTFTMIISGENSLGQVIASPTNEITYPSELTYYTNSKAVTSTGAHAASDYPKTVSNWDAAPTSAWTGDWTFPGTVDATTTAAAIRQNIKYGAAQLVSTVKITPNGSGNLIDNAKKITVTNDAYDLLEDKENQEITYADNLFTLNGILVGGQPALSDWQFLPKSGTTMSRVVYDNAINTNTITQSVTSPYEPTYTLVMDNFKSGSPIPTQDVVNIALEIVNNGNDFYGADGLIPHGATFYLVGKLDPTTPSSGSPIDWTGTYDGTNNTIAHPGRGTQRVFIQDFKTMVNFTIPSDGLQRAYSSIPDLRSTKLLFGLSVDLTWKTGLTFNVNL